MGQAFDTRTPTERRILLTIGALLLVLVLLAQCGPDPAPAAATRATEVPVALGPEPCAHRGPAVYTTDDQGELRRYQPEDP